MAGSSGSSQSPDGRKKARIEIIPLIDVIFFLLATFVLFTLSLNKIQSLPINLPKADSTPSQPRPDDVTIQVSDGETLYWNKNVVLLAELPSNLKNYIAQANEPHILIAGDALAKYGTTVRVLDELKKAGLGPTQYSVETKIRNTGQ